MVKKGYDNLAIGTFLCAENFDSVPELARVVHSWGVKHAFNSYSRLKNDNQSHVLDLEQAAKARDVVERLVARKRTQGNILTSDDYLRSIPGFFAAGQLPGCVAGDKFLYVDQQGYVKQCPELPPIAHISNLERLERPPVSCGLCWYACRGEHQSRLTPNRILEIIG